MELTTILNQCYPQPGFVYLKARFRADKTTNGNARNRRRPRRITNDNERTANALGALVLSGQKRATAGLLWTNEVTNKPLPTIGALSVVTDWHGTPLCVIESTHVEIVPFDSVSDSFAAIEGEGDKTLRYWRDAHWRFFSRECQRIGREPDPRMPVVCEQFKVVYPLAVG